MTAYYQTHPVGALYLVVVAFWYTMEIVEFFRQRQWRAASDRIGPPGYWPAFWASATVAAAVLFLAPHVVPGATIAGPAAGFAVGMAMLAVGVALRLWSFAALGRYFTFTVTVKPGQPVITSGPYRLLRHPGYAGGLLATIGIGVMWGNWVGLATLAVFVTVFVLWRIHTEETALLATLDGEYRAYAAHHKRLVPLVW